jgi:3-phenylpropionate/trans-cinnamate dioxygenase ferredoxin component
MSEWVRVAAVEDCPKGGLLGVVIGDRRIVLAHGEGGIHALLDRCSHADFPLSDGFLEGDTLECIHHGAQFDVTSGKATRFPAIRPVPVFPVEVRGSDVFVQVG